MAGAYTPGLTVSGDIVVRRVRRLPIKGEVLVKDGEAVQPHTAVARALLPGALQTIKLAEKLGVEAKDAASQVQIKPGETIEKGQLIAESKGFLGRFKQQVVSDFTGTVDSISGVTGNMLVREAPIPVEINAYIEGQIVDILPEEGAIVETRCAMVQGIFGVGGERTGVVRLAVADPQKPLEASDIQASDAGKFLVGGSGVTADALTRAGTVGVAGIITGGVRDADLIKLLGYDIGVAITGQENIPFTLVVTEGFGFLSMAIRTFDLLRSLEGKAASINGATQIRAGVIRPELIVPLAADVAKSTASQQTFELTIGAPIRVIREPYFGQLGTVTELPSQLVTVDSGTEVRVLKAKLADSRDVVVPRANVEIIAN
ncbi:MAG: hypothetical protein ACYC96_03565 [Fimbriimonadaceae bacterium]